MVSKQKSFPKFLQVLKGESLWPPPVWLMRQAGRYLPEYRALRAEAGDFLKLVYNPELACEITLQPIRRFGFDAAILFSDILVIPHALGCELNFTAGEGPQLLPLGQENELSQLNLIHAEKKLELIFETAQRAVEALGEEIPLIGFCGGPWTVSTYMIAGKGGDEQQAAKKIAYEKPKFLERLIDILIETSISYLKGQVRAGARCLQIFESWAGSLDSFAFETFVIEPTARLVKKVKAEFPNIPIIGFPRGAGGLLRRYTNETGITAVGLDWEQSLAECARDLKIPFQGNLDPLRLLAPPESLNLILENIKSVSAGKPYIFNLGHGILPQTPIAHVEALVKWLREE